jgi:hypothetical protein
MKRLPERGPARVHFDGGSVQEAVRLFGAGRPPTSVRRKPSVSAS